MKQKNFLLINFICLFLFSTNIIVRIDAPDVMISDEGDQSENNKENVNNNNVNNIIKTINEHEANLNPIAKTISKIGTTLNIPHQGILFSMQEPEQETQETE